MSEARKQGFAEIATALSLRVDNRIETTEGVLQALANSSALERDDLDTVYAPARRMAPMEYSVVVSSDLSGKQLLNTRVPFGADLPKGASNPMALRTRLGSTAIVVSNLFFAPVGKRYDSALQIPVIRDDQVRYDPSVGVAVARSSRLLSNMEFPAGWSALMIDRNGTVVARSSASEQFVGRSVREKLLVRIQTQEAAGVLYGITLDNVHTAIFFHRSPISIPFSQA